MDVNSFFFISFLFVLLILRMLSDSIVRGGTFFVFIVEIGTIPEEADEEDWIELHTTGKQISLKKEEKSLIIDSDICNRACSSSALLNHQKLGNRKRHSVS